MTRLGDLHRGDIFFFEGVVYIAIVADGFGNALVYDSVNGKIIKLCLDVEVQQ